MNIDSKSAHQNGGHARWTFRHAKGLWLVAAVLVALTIFITASQPSSASFPLWVSSGLIRVGQNDAPGMTSAIMLSGARGETVDTQVIVQAPANGLTNVNVSASALPKLLDHLAPLTVVFNSTVSGGDGGPYSYNWNFAAGGGASHGVGTSALLRARAESLIAFADSARYRAAWIPDHTTPPTTTTIATANNFSTSGFFQI